MTTATVPKGPEPRRPIVHLNGLPGVGKLTIARFLLRLLPSAKLDHIHLLINPADAVLHRTQPGYQALRQAIRQTIFSTLSSEVVTAVCAEYLATSELRRAAFIPIILFCDEETNMQRIISSDRELHSKLTDVKLVRKFRLEEDVHRFIGHPNYLELDVSTLTPEEAARQICEHLKHVCP
ncbi:hypothetical protein N7520_001774 [Penicillium odoratum]|uniref:uncharacterized protein n=1 Tax=Penicillium odoratum TaxID=1167516 RepID=UPI002548D8FC|nr:uncharacterized protein N7520_001774 [Penicillium odoratum]KAJ5778528.1 hypothetical protein N7520_001774 [Penicillium odoratum]